jgi:hypothetical protein
MNNFFETKKISKCDKCIITKKNKKGELKSFHKENDLFIRKGNEKAEILIILSRYEIIEYVNKLGSFLEKFKFKDYAIVNGLQCNFLVPKNLKLVELYSYCNNVDLKIFPNLKVIITLGSAIYNITKSTDIGHWSEFKEFLFNQTYFYTGFNEERKIRVYPLPYIDEIFNNDCDSFEYFFSIKQIGFIKEFLNGK